MAIGFYFSDHWFNWKIWSQEAKRKIRIIEYAFGDIYAGAGLDLKSKEIAVAAASTAQPQLKVHINGALNTGSNINEIKEVILQNNKLFRD